MRYPCDGRVFSDVRPAHHDRHASAANGVGHIVGARDHSGHRTDTDEFDLFLDDVAHEFLFIHGARVAVNQENFTPGGRERLQEKHPPFGFVLLTGLGLIISLFCFTPAVAAQQQDEGSGIKPPTAMKPPTVTEDQQQSAGSRQIFAEEFTKNRTKTSAEGVDLGLGEKRYILPFKSLAHYTDYIECASFTVMLNLQIFSASTSFPLMKAMLFALWSDELIDDVSDFHCSPYDYTPHS